MPRSLNVGDIRTRRDGTIILKQGTADYQISSPRTKLWARYYRDDSGSWCVDVYKNDNALMRAFVSAEAIAEEAASAVIREVPTGLIWYDLQAVIQDRPVKAVSV